MEWRLWPSQRSHDPDIPITTQGKTINQFLPLKEPLAYQSGHNSLVSAINAEKVAIVPLLNGAKGRGRSAGANHPGIWHDVSSGSEHQPSSVCLAVMVLHEFIEEAHVDAKCGRSRCNCQIGTCDGVVEEYNYDDSKSVPGGELFKVLQGLVACISEEERMLSSYVKKAVCLLKEQADQICEAESAECRKGCLKREFECSKGCLKRALMNKLREGGYNAAICKSKSDHNIGFPGGVYQYIDVVWEDSHGNYQRLIVDTEFQCQFEIARPTQQYMSILQELPVIFTGKPERLQHMLNLMSEAVKTSMRKRCMPVPPWRKSEYMRAKWLSSYKRTTNAASNHQRSNARHQLVSGELAHTTITIKGFDQDHLLKNKLESHTDHVRTSDWKKSKKGMLRSHKLGGLEVARLMNKHSMIMNKLNLADNL